MYKYPQFTFVYNIFVSSHVTVRRYTSSKLASSGDAESADVSVWRYVAREGEGDVEWKARVGGEKIQMLIMLMSMKTSCICSADNAAEKLFADIEKKDSGSYDAIVQGLVKVRCTCASLAII